MSRQDSDESCTFTKFVTCSGKKRQSVSIMQGISIKCFIMHTQDRVASVFETI